MKRITMCVTIKKGSKFEGNEYVEGRINGIIYAVARTFNPRFPTFINADGFNTKAHVTEEEYKLISELINTCTYGDSCIIKILAEVEI